MHKPTILVTIPSHDDTTRYLSAWSKPIIELAQKKKDLIKHVKKSDSIGKMIVKVELDYLRSLKNITQSVLNNA